MIIHLEIYFIIRMVVLQVSALGVYLLLSRIMHPWPWLIFSSHRDISRFYYSGGAG